jgi:hypothetical protein
MPNATRPTAAHVECQCGNTHNSPNGQIPVGWTICGAKTWCDDCTRAGVPVREQLESRRNRRRAA